MDRRGRRGRRDRGVRGRDRDRQVALAEPASRRPRRRTNRSPPSMRSTTRCAPSSRSPTPRARRCSTRSTGRDATSAIRSATGEAHLDSLRQPDDTGPILRRVARQGRRHEPGTRPGTAGRHRRRQPLAPGDVGVRPRCERSGTLAPWNTTSSSLTRLSTIEHEMIETADRGRAARSRRSRSTACAACTDRCARPHAVRRLRSAGRAAARAVRRARLPLRQPPADVPEAPRRRSRRARRSATTPRCATRSTPAASPKRAGRRSSGRSRR